MHPLKKPTNRISFTAIHPWFQQRERRVKLPEDSLGLVALGRTEGIATRITVLSKSPIMETQSFLSGALPSECHQPGRKQYPQLLDSLSPQLVELGAQLGPSHAQWSPAERTTVNCLKLQKGYRGLGTDNIWNWYAPESLPKGPNQHTQWPNSDIRLDLIVFKNSIIQKEIWNSPQQGKFCFM